MIILTYNCKTYSQRNWEKYFWWKNVIFNIHCIIFSKSEQGRANPISQIEKMCSYCIQASQYIYIYIYYIICVCVCVSVSGGVFASFQYTHNLLWLHLWEFKIECPGWLSSKHLDKDSFAWALIWILLFRQARRNAILVSIAVNMGGNNLRLKHSRGGLSTSVNVIRAKWSGERGPWKEQRREKGAMPFKQVFTQRLGAESQTVGAQGWVTLLRAEEFFVI